ncbi:MAG: hypothetical protein WEA99_09165 [Brumimicrobium sp.]
MNTAELKNQLHKLIVETDDLDVLTKIQSYIRQLKTKNSDWWDEIGAESKASIERGLDDLKNDRVHNDQDVRNSVRERISKAKKG